MKKLPNHGRFLPAVLLQVQQADPEVQNAIIDQSDAYGWRVLDVSVTPSMAPDVSSPIGAIVHNPDKELISRLQDMGLPVVQISLRDDAGYPSLPVIHYDPKAIGRLAADHFADRQFRRVAYIGYNPWRASKPLFDGLQERAEERGCECHLLQLEFPIDATGKELTS